AKASGVKRMPWDCSIAKKPCGRPIPAMIFYRFYRAKVESLVVDMEQQAIKLVEIIQGDRK
ncbi:MAG TPA: hypothetical protein VF501_09270, partial [Thiobacillus sp.]